MQPVIKSKTFEWEIKQLLQRTTDVKYYQNYEEGYGAPLLETLLKETLEEVGHPEGAIYDLVAENNVVQLTLHWLELE